MSEHDQLDGLSVLYQTIPMVHGIEFSKLQTIGSWVWSLENHCPHEKAIIGARPQSSDKPTSSHAQTHHPHITPAGYPLVN